MHATVWPGRIDIVGAGGFPEDSWKPMLDELKAEHVPGQTPTGKRLTVVVNPSGGVDAFVCRTAPMSDEEVIRVLRKYGVEATISSVDAASA
jgi:hypothetical protein